MCALATEEESDRKRSTVVVVARGRLSAFWHCDTRPLEGRRVHDSWKRAFERLLEYFEISDTRSSCTREERACVASYDGRASVRLPRVHRVVVSPTDDDDGDEEEATRA